ncbi:MAG: Arc family DNA-binding protein [Candidatus Sumerlaeota bacterium]|nr:Arc family DNA-binding protein [Candidatus Sumerlaeota bacterium]
MHAIIMENMPDDLYDVIEQRAQRDHRAVSDEIMTCLQEAILRIDPLQEEIMMNQAQGLREKIGGYRTDQEITSMKIWGRS